MKSVHMRRRVRWWPKRTPHSTPIRSVNPLNFDRLASETTKARKLIDHLDQAILAKAFQGELVPQDPNDEPASVLLERIRAERHLAPTRRNERQKVPRPRRRALRSTKPT
jgi:hypothetical protein